MVTGRAVMGLSVLFSVLLLMQSISTVSTCYGAEKKVFYARRPVEMVADADTSEDEAAAIDFLNEVNAGLHVRKHEAALARFNYLTDMTEQHQQTMNDMDVELSNFHQSILPEARVHYANVDSYGNEMVKRMLTMLVKYDLSPKVPGEKEAREESELVSRMTLVTSTATVWYEGEQLTMEPDLADVMANTFDYDVLRDMWVEWRNATRVMRQDFTRLVEIVNQLAWDNGFRDYGQVQREADFEMPASEVDSLLEELWQQVEPLYSQLHAYVRRKLIDQYPDRGIRGDGPIPAHLLGNMWAQQWNNLLPIVMPYSEAPTPDVTLQLQLQDYTPNKMFELAESFFVSLGMNPMTDIFWQKSVLTKQPDKDMDCHGSAHDLHATDDFRIKMCTEVDMDYLKTVHHEMGHIHYYMNYAHQPELFRGSAHSGFHEAVGDTVALSVMTLQHLRQINLLPNTATTDQQTREGEINMLMKMALEKVPLLPFAYIVDKWRWAVYSGEISEHNYNEKWWQYRLAYQGLEPPVPRSDPHDFDPAAKYHIAADVPYIRYYVSFISQFQFLKALCAAAGHTGPLHTCDVYGSKQAGNKLREMLSVGQSKPWWEVMEKMTGTAKIDAGPLLEYFQPLLDYLQAVNTDNNEYIGWR